MVQIDAGETPAQALRRQWGESLTEHLRTTEVTRKELQARLKAEGVDVSLQAISLWCTGQSAPRSHIQPIIAKVLHTPTRSLFSLTVAA